MRKTAMLALFLAFIVVACISVYAGKPAAARPLDTTAVCSDSVQPADTAARCDKRVCPAVNENGCPRVLCDTDNGLCCYRCSSGGPYQCL